MKPMRWLLCLSAAAVCGGCYHYVPTTGLAQPQGAEVRAHLDTLQSFELAAITVNNINQVEGEMVRADGRDLILSATWLEAVTGNGFPGSGWTVRIPESNVTGLDLKKVSWWRTGVVLGGLVAGTWIGFDALGVGPFGSEGGGGTGPIL